MRPIAVALVLVVLGGRGASLSAADRPWLEVKSPHFTGLAQTTLDNYLKALAR